MTGAKSKAVMTRDMRHSYLALALAALLPIVLFVSIVAVVIGLREQSALGTRALANVREIANGIDQYIAAQLKEAQVMAASNALQAGELAKFYDLAERLKKNEPAWADVILLDTRGHQVLNLRRPLGAKLPDVIDRASFNELLIKKRPVIGDLVPDEKVVNVPFVSIRVPVWVNGAIKYVLTIALDPRKFSSLFAFSDAPRDWVGAVVDRNGRLLARSVLADKFVGRYATPVALKAIKKGDQGIYEGYTLEGLDTVFAFYTSPLTGWSVHYAVPRAAYQAPLYHMAWFLLLAGVLAVSLAIILFLVVARQNAARRRADIASLQSQKLEALGQFTSGISHDFNNLLMAIMGNLELAANKLSGHAAARNVERAYTAAKRGADLNAQLLAFARQKPLQPTVGSLNDLVNNSKEFLRGTLGHAIVLHVDLASDLWPAAFDEAQIEVAVLNLVANARDAMAAGGKLTIATRNVPGGSAVGPAAKKGKDFVVLEVRDSGLGMTPDVVERALEPFFTTKQAGKGTGLGLSQIHGMVTQHGGYMGIDSAPGKGTTVRVFLPRAQAKSPARANMPSLAVKSHSPPKRILVIDDDEAVRISVSEMLRSLGHEIVEAASGRQGLRLLDGGAQIDLVLTDHAMPEMTGAEFAERIHKTRPSLKVAIMTGNTEAVPATKAIAATIRKPFSREALSEQLGI